MLDQIKKYNITNYEFFDAIRPTVNDIQMWNNKLCYHVKHHVSASKFQNYQIGCLGCMKSHYEVMKLALSCGHKNILILEDDTVFKNNFSKIEEYSNQINHEYDMLYLAGTLGKKNKETNNISRINGLHTTGAYLIKEKVMEIYCRKY